MLFLKNSIVISFFTISFTSKSTSINDIPYRFGRLNFAVLRNGLVHIVYTFGRQTIGHIVVNPYKLSDANTVPMPDGKWPGGLPAVN